MLGDEAVAVMNWSVGGYGGYVVTVNSHQSGNWLTHLAVYGITTTHPSPVQVRRQHRPANSIQLYRCSQDGFRRAISATEHPNENTNP
jgi:hypothetical protein